jgi:hypothetical protein
MWGSKRLQLTFQQVQELAPWRLHREELNHAEWEY